MISGKNPQQTETETAEECIAEIGYIDRIRVILNPAEVNMPPAHISAHMPDDRMKIQFRGDLFFRHVLNPSFGDNAACFPQAFLLEKQSPFDRQ